MAINSNLAPAPYYVYAQLAVKSAASAPAAFRTPPGCCVPFGVMELALAALPPTEQHRYAALLRAAETAVVADLDGVCDEIQVGCCGGGVLLAAVAGRCQRRCPQHSTTILHAK